jgi:hypothetical protein
MAKAKTGLIAIGTVITGGAEYTNGQEIKGDLDKAEVEWLRLKPKLLKPKRRNN